MYSAKFPLMPSLGTVKSIFGDLGGNVNGFSSVQVIPRSVSQVFMATITLLSASVPPVDSIQRRSIRDNQIADLESILCDGGRIWPALTSAGRFEGCISTACIGAFVNFLRLVLFNSSKVNGSSAIFCRAAFLLSQVLCFALASQSQSTLGSFLESELCLALVDLSDMSKESISLSRHVSENLLPSLRNTVRSDESSPILKALLVG